MACFLDMLLRHDAGHLLVILTGREPGSSKSDATEAGEYIDVSESFRWAYAAPCGSGRTDATDNAQGGGDGALPMTLPGAFMSPGDNIFDEDYKVHKRPGIFLQNAISRIIVRCNRVDTYTFVFFLTETLGCLSQQWDDAMLGDQQWDDAIMREAISHLFTMEAPADDEGVQVRLLLRFFAAIIPLHC